MAGATLGAPPARFAWQAQHLEHLRLVLRLRCCVHDMGALCQVSTDFAATERAHSCAEKTSTMRPSQPMGTALVCFSSCSTILPFCTSTHHHLHNTIYITPSTLHRQHNTVNTIYTTSSNTTSSTHTHTPSTLHHQQTSSTQPHQHITIYKYYKTPSTQHHLHNIIHTTPSTLHHHILEGAALGALPSYPFCLIPGDTPLVILRCGLFFVLFP